MRTLRIDIETYSPVDLKKAGVYPYASHPEFEILLFGYAYDLEPTTVIDLASGSYLPASIMKDLYSADVLKTAFNAQFEITCLNFYLGSKGWLPMVTGQWECTMVKAAMLGLPLSLAKVAEVLNLPIQKMSVGATLIRYFCIPCKPTAANGGRSRNLPMHDRGKWDIFKKYCATDVDTERAIARKLSFYEVPKFEKDLWVLDQKINSRGVLLNIKFAENAISIDKIVRTRLTDRAILLTGLTNPNSGAQLKRWLEVEMDEEVESLTKTTVPALLKKCDSDTVKQVLEIRQELSKTSVKKYQAMLNAVCWDGRIRGLTQYYGANRTGRWAGRFVQLQNLPQNHLTTLDFARNLVLKGDIDYLDMFYDSIPDTLSQLIRTSFIAGNKKLLYVADYSAIEARVIAWLADEKWRLEVFATHGKIYEASASKMFGVPMNTITKGSELRQKGKVAELACGYGGGVGALEKMGALAMGLKSSELKGIITAWREANPAIVKLWYKMENAAIKSLKEGSKEFVAKGLYFEYNNNILYMVLPSGRKLCYVRPKIGEGKFGGECITYEGMNQNTKKWETQDTYGGKLTENAIQAIARDCLAVSMVRLDQADYDIDFHVHDEVVAEHSDETPEETLKDITSIMSRPIEWAPGLLLPAEGYFTTYYKKD